MQIETLSRKLKDLELQNIIKYICKNKSDVAVEKNVTIYVKDTQDNIEEEVANKDHMPVLEETLEETTSNEFSEEEDIVETITSAQFLNNIHHFKEFKN